MKVLVTGISGALARLLTLRLIEAGHKVIGIDKRPWLFAEPMVGRRHD